jgi:DNA-directed RNA polymerase specialized sigma24 family protein
MRDRVKGDDLLSETMLKLFENQSDKLCQLAHDGGLFAYVNRSLYLMAIDKSSRYGTKYRNYESRWMSDSRAYESERDAPWLGSRLDNEYLDAYIAMMPDLDATMLRLYMMTDFSYQRCSDETGIEVKTLYKLVEKAINKIKRNVHQL